jgi:hypothetical protein
MGGTRSKKSGFVVANLSRQAASDWNLKRADACLGEGSSGADIVRMHPFAPVEWTHAGYVSSPNVSQVEKH